MGSRPRNEEAPPAPGHRRSCSLVDERSRVRGLFAIELEAYGEGSRAVAGVDEVGRGCLAGPVYAGAVVLTPDAPLSGLDDSKALLPEVRRDLEPRIKRHARAVGI
ncbi:MAG TPA: hypothetical protein VGR00_00020, partial [Thermoanaerobaculia bacterium]|nr:hypothetical protein [Thermoanaerobaculia bacterium]